MPTNHELETCIAELESLITDLLADRDMQKKRADEWQAFVEARGEQLPGYERDLAQATESVRLCAALRNASQDALVEAFANYSP